MAEECMVCHEPTGKAGRDEDSLYTPNGVGPFCEQCWDDAWPVMVPNAAPDPALLATLAEWRQLAETQDAIIQRGPALTDPALLALAKLGAMVLDWSPLECGFPTIPGGVIDDMAVRSGCALEDASDGGHECWTAPGVRLAIAALLAPDGADGAGEVTP